MYQTPQGACRKNLKSARPTVGGLYRSMSPHGLFYAHPVRGDRGSRPTVMSRYLGLTKARPHGNKNRGHISSADFLSERKDI